MAAREPEEIAVGDIIKSDSSIMLVVRDLTSEGHRLKLVCISKNGRGMDSCAHIYQMTAYPKRWEKVGHFDGI